MILLLIMRRDMALDSMPRWQLTLALLCCAAAIAQAQYEGMLHLEEVTHGILHVSDGPDGSSWGTVCDDYFTVAAGLVACRQMFDNVERVEVSNRGDTYGYDDCDDLDYSWRGCEEPILLDDIRCDGTEAALTDCARNDWGSNDCEHYEDVVLTCYLNKEGSVRLTDGPTHDSGRVEVFHDGQWGTVCLDSFDIAEAYVVCNQLFDNIKDVVIYSNLEQLSERTIWLDDLHCHGRESSIGDCDRDRSWGQHDCTHHQDAWLHCVLVPDGTIRLADGDTRGSGLLEVIHNDFWGTVCADQYFNEMAADVVCHELAGAWVNASFWSEYTEWEALQWMPNWLTAVDCSGTEGQLIECPNRGSYDTWGYDRCGFSSVIYVSCDYIPEGSLRLMTVDGEESTHRGHLQIYHDDQWGSVTEDGFQKRKKYRLRLCVDTTADVNY